jgi:hypothetical protein
MNQLIVSSKHISRRHDKRYQCDIQGCQAAFGLRADLHRHQQSRRHSESYTGAREQFACSTCQRRFTRKDNFKRHERNCHSSTTSLLKSTAQPIDSSEPPDQFEPGPKRVDSFGLTDLASPICEFDTFVRYTEAAEPPNPPLLQKFASARDDRMPTAVWPLPSGANSSTAEAEDSHGLDLDESFALDLQRFLEDFGTL